MLLRASVLCVAACFCAAGWNTQPGSPGSTSAARTAEIDVSASQQWLDTGVDIRAGDTVSLSAGGTLKYGASSAGPDGLARSWRDLLLVLPVSDCNRGALVGRIGSGESARPFLVGPERDIVAPRDGRLFLSVNQSANDVSEGSFHVGIRVTPGKPTPDKTKGLKLAAVSQAILDSLPRRVSDAEGNPGDTVNFLIVGSEQKMLAAFEAAGWVRVDRTPRDAVLHGVLASLSKQAYTQLPMSELQLFGRPQDYGMAHAEPFSVVAQRHHFRIWKAPQTVDGQTLWVGAGTHDIGFDKDQRNGKVTHKIDPDIDKERQFIADSLEDTGSVLKIEYMTPAHPVTQARTAHGENYSSDGRTLVVWLEPENVSAASGSGTSAR